FAGSARANHSLYHFFCAVWISRVPCRQLCVDRLCQRMVEMSLPGRIYCRSAQQPAYGFLQPCHYRERCAAAWAQGVTGGCDEIRLELYAGRICGAVALAREISSPPPWSALCARVARAGRSGFSE